MVRFVHIFSIHIIAGLLFLTPSVAAQNDVSGQIKWAGKAPHLVVVDQNTAYADQLRKYLEAIELPTGFKVSLFAIAPGARQMAVSPQGIAVFVGTRTSDVWVVTDRDKDRVADEVTSFAPAAGFKAPTGVCFSRNGFLYVVEHNRVRAFPAAEYSYESAGGPMVEIVPWGNLKPDEDFANTLWACEVGADNKLYVFSGEALNESFDVDNVIRMKPDGTNREVLSDKIRGSASQGTNSKHAPQATKLGMLYTGTMFPEQYRGIFWPRPTGVMFTPDKGSDAEIEPFAEGWSLPPGKTNRLADLAQLHDGSILVSDEQAGAIYRIYYGQ